MNKPNVSKFFKDIQNGVSKHSPEILTGFGIAGMLTTVVLAVKATPKALEKIEDKKAELCSNHLTPIETVQAAWKPYVPAAITGTAATICLIGANSVQARRNAALATAYQISTQALADYKEKVVETIGEKKEKTVRDKVAQKKVDDAPVANASVYETGKGETLHYDPQFANYFRCNVNAIDKAVNTLNDRMLSGQTEYISVNDFYDELGVKRFGMGDELGWNLGRDGLIRIDHSHAIITENGEPCVVITYEVAPKYEYFKINRS